MAISREWVKKAGEILPESVSPNEANFLVPTVLRGNAVFDALRRPPGPPAEGPQSGQDRIPTEDRGNEC